MSSWSTFTVPSASRIDVTHTVTHDGTDWYCSCEGERYGRRAGQKRCSHIASVETSVRLFAGHFYGDRWPERYWSYYVEQWHRQTMAWAQRATVAA